MPDLQHRPVGAPAPVRQHSAAPVVVSVIAEDPGVRFAALGAGLFAVVAVCRAVDLDPVRSIAVVLVGLGAGCLTLPLRWAIAAGACAWGFVTGFVVNDAGQLTFDGGDLRRAAVLLALAAAASVVAGRRAPILTRS